MTFEVTIRHAKGGRDGLTTEYWFETQIVEAENEEEIFGLVRIDDCCDAIAGIREKTLMPMPG